MPDYLFRKNDGHMLNLIFIAKRDDLEGSDVAFRDAFGPHEGMVSNRHPELASARP
jgi:hypothetical protein